MPLKGSSLKRLILVVALIHSPIVLAQSNRGYDSASLALGETLYLQHCAVCHGNSGESTVQDWHKRDASGKFPPPPLNGTAHTWHHPFADLMQTIANGTQGKGGGMPAWKEKMSQKEIYAVIMWITSMWPDEIYAAWIERH